MKQQTKGTFGTTIDGGMVPMTDEEWKQYIERVFGDTRPLTPEEKEKLRRNAKACGSTLWDD